MRSYMTTCFTAIFPFGILAKGEILEEKHLEALGKAGVADMLARGAIKALDDSEKPETPDGEAPEAPADDAEEPTGALPEELPGGEEDVPDDEELTGLDDLVEDEAPVEAAPPAEKRKRRSKAK